MALIEKNKDLQTVEAGPLDDLLGGLPGGELQGTPSANLALCALTEGESEEESQVMQQQDSLMCHVQAGKFEDDFTVRCSSRNSPTSRQGKENNSLEGGDHQADEGKDLKPV